MTNAAQKDKGIAFLVPCMCNRIRTL